MVGQAKSNIPNQFLEAGGKKGFCGWKKILFRTMLKELTLVLLNPDLTFHENTVDPDQMASHEAI